MKKSRFSEAQILGILRQQDQGQTVVQICREHGISELTFYAWKSKFGGMSMSVSELQRLKHLEDENRRLKQLVADLSLENQVVKEVLRKK
jgi:putative transposase